MLPTGTAGHLDDGLPVLGQARNGHRQRRVHACHVTDGGDLHVDDRRVLDRVRDLQDPGDAVLIGQAEVLVPFADERLGRAPDAEEGAGQVLGFGRAEVGRIGAEHVGRGSMNRSYTLAG